jgi:uncharacterized protein (DUF302 family)
MKKITILGIILCTAFALSAQNLKPYVVGFESTESIKTVQTTLVEQLKTNGIDVVGQYQPANDNNRWLIVFSSNELQSAVKKVGGLTGFASTLRIAITVENGKTVVSYTQPEYWGNAYFRADYDKVASLYAALKTKLETSMKACGSFSGKTFGSKDGIDAKGLRKYHYMMAMPYFEDVVELGEFQNYATAIATIDKNMKKGVPGVKLVSKVSIPGKELTQYTFALNGANGESKFLPIIDNSNPKHTAFLPYEVLVNGKEVVMLHGRYRIALSFPDLTMGTFTKIMSTPGDIEDALKQVVL